jgi:2-dehydro-3-deoxyphosphogluconate aldolase/(4S)-4-hydroxy-2-oxoglutarate aldolase
MTRVDSLLAISPVIPVVTLRSADHAVSLAGALLEGGIGIVEITLRTRAALDSIEGIAREFPRMAVLAGTVCNAAQVRDAMQAGAAGLVSPGLTDPLAAAVRQSETPWLPGIATASDIMRGLDLGLTRFKLFPAVTAGGPAALRAFAGPFPDLKFCPTGGIDRDSAPTYLALGNVACVGGSWLATEALMQAGDWGAIRDNARFAAALPRSQG